MASEMRKSTKKLGRVAWEHYQETVVELHEARQELRCAQMSLESSEENECVARSKLLAIMEQTFAA